VAADTGSVDAGVRDAGAPRLADDATFAFDLGGRRVRVVSNDSLEVYDIEGMRRVIANDWPSQRTVHGWSADATDHVIRVVADEGLFFYDSDTGAARSSVPFPAGRRVDAIARDVALVSDGTDTDLTRSIVELPTGRMTRLPSGWFHAMSNESVTLSENGDRLAVVDSGGGGPLVAVIYDTQRRARVGSLRFVAPALPGGLYHGSLEPDGRTLKWCWTRGGCTKSSLDDSTRRPAEDREAVSPKWRVALPLPSGDDAERGAYRVRDAAGRLVGHLDFDDGGLVATSFCHDADRFVVGTEKALYAFHLPDGRRLARIPLDTPIARVACARDGRHVALSLSDRDVPTTLAVVALP
jgi:hypothetical protein